MAFTEITVSPGTPMPKGYKLLIKGYPFMTALCRRKTHAAGHKLYVVRAGSQNIGLRAPAHIIHQVYEEERQTRATRRATVCVRDDAARRTFKAALCKEFPNMPATDTETVLGRALEKGSGRVGRTSTLRMEDKARLAVVAHIRHVYTDYDVLVRGERSKEEARRMVFDKVGDVLQQWRGKGGWADGESDYDVDVAASPSPPPRERQQQRLRPNGLRVRARAMARRTTTVERLGRGGDEDVGEVASPSSLDEVIVISSDSEDDDVFDISSDEPWCVTWPP